MLLLVACESDNEHFCARYQYVYQQLVDEPDLPTYTEMKQKLLADLSAAKQDDDQAKFMLFILEDWHSEMKPQHEDGREFCMRVKRWQYYQ
ncbi:hypothetical protein [Oceanicoccus sp. KOV_DT_Chl]|uniref:hypothetical protein n=1 Tax=Oceanicoccus sp. KOV_DT_Chl TaxID=1904639 RepID=UPI000C7B1D3D|nr:hypothetical protein [Oceanicoccus sp. KOV_DT_Chl]